MCCQGEPIDMASMQPEWMEALGRNIAGYFQEPTEGGGARFAQPATALPEGFPLTSPVNPLSMMGANVMSQYMGGGPYQQPPPGSYDYQMPGTDYQPPGRGPGPVDRDHEREDGIGDGYDDYDDHIFPSMPMEPPIQSPIQPPIQPPDFRPVYPPNISPIQTPNIGPTQLPMDFQWR